MHRSIECVPVNLQICRFADLQNLIDSEIQIHGKYPKSKIWMTRFYVYQCYVLRARTRIKTHIVHTTSKQLFDKEQESRIIQLLDHTFEHNISFHLHDDLSTNVVHHE